MWYIKDSSEFFEKLSKECLISRNLPKTTSGKSALNGRIEGQ